MAKELTNEEQEEYERLKSEIKITTDDDEQPFVFVSYKSDDRLKMLRIIHELHTRYNLRVYYDEAFESGNDDWLSQFEKNLKSWHCYGVLVFRSKMYLTSYATLMELMCSQTDHRGVKPIVNITIEKPNSIEKPSNSTGFIFSSKEKSNNTGLGDNGENEVKAFNRYFSMLKDNKENKLEGLENLYLNNNNLDWGECSNFIEKLIAHCKVHMHNAWQDTPEKICKNLVSAIEKMVKNKYGDDISVFGEPAKNTAEQPVKVEEHAEIKKLEPSAVTAPKPLEPSAPPAPPAPSAEGELLYEIKSGEVNARFTQKTDEYGKATYILHAGSRIARTVAVSAPDGAKRKRQELEAVGLLVDSVVHTEVEFGSSSALGCFCRGSSESGTRFVKASRLISGGNAEPVSDTVDETETDAAVCVPEVREPEPQVFDNNKDGEYYETTKAGVNARYKVISAENGKTFVLLSGSHINPSVANSAPAGATRRREELAAEGKLVDFTVTEDVEFTSASALASFCVGGSKSGTEFIEKDSRLISGIPAADCNNASESSVETENGYSSGIIGENRLIK